MSQVRIECPKCQTKGKLDSKSIPSPGANIRCPSCRAVFFVKATTEDGTSASRSGAVPAPAKPRLNSSSSLGEQPGASSLGVPRGTGTDALDISSVGLTAGGFRATGSNPAAAPTSPDASTLGSASSASGESDDDGADLSAAQRAAIARRRAASSSHSSVPGAVRTGRQARVADAVRARRNASSSLGGGQSASASAERSAPPVGPGASTPGDSGAGSSGLGGSGLGSSSPGSSGLGSSGLGSSGLGSSNLGQRSALLPSGLRSDSTEISALTPRGQTSPGDSGFPRDLSMSDVHPTVGPADTLDIELEPAPHSRSVRPVGSAASVDQLQRNRARRGRLTGVQAPAPERVAARLRSESGNVAAASAAVSGPTAASTTSAAVRVADVSGKGGATRWKVRTSAGMVYDFPDTDSLRGWLSSRNSLDDLDVSSDGGASFTPVIGHQEFGTIQPRGYRTAAIRVPSQGLRSGNSGLISVADSGERPLERMETGSRPISTSGESGLLSTSGPTSASASGASPIAPSAAPTKSKRKPTREERREAARAEKEAKRAAKRKAKEKAARQKEKRQRKARRGASDRPSGHGRAIGLLILLAMVALAAVGFQRLSGPPQIPNTPAGEQFRWILSAMNGQAQVMRENEIIEHFAPSALESVAPRDMLDQLRWWHERNPGYIYNGVQRGSTSLVIQAKVSTVLQDHGLITVRVEENPPHRIIDFTINAVAVEPTVPNFDDL